METPRDQQRQQLHDALEQLEASVETPFVPGELEHWIAAADSAWQTLRPVLTWLLTVRHPQEYAEIRQEDQELIRRVERMRLEDAEIEKAAADIGQQIPRLESAIASVEPDEAKLRRTMNDFVSDALSFIIRVRTQEQAVRTWLMEAFTRDRGLAD